MNTDVNNVRVAVTAFSASRKFPNMLFCCDHLSELRKAPTLAELFTILGQFEYWSWDNHHLLKSITEIFGNDEMKEMIKLYEKELEAFRINTKLSQYAVVIAKESQSDTSPKSDFMEVFVKLGAATWSEYTLKSVQDFWESMIEEFQITPYSLHFHKAKPGCVRLTFLIASCLAPFLIVESKCRQKFFAAHHIQHLIVNGHTIEFNKAGRSAQTQQVRRHKKHCVQGTPFLIKSVTTCVLIRANDMMSVDYWRLSHVSTSNALRIINTN